MPLRPTDRPSPLLGTTSNIMPEWFQAQRSTSKSYELTCLTVGRVQLLGADNPDAHRGIYSDGLVLDEAGLMQARAWTEVFRPALSDRMGWALFIGTPNGKNLFWDLRTQAESR